MLTKIICFLFDEKEVTIGTIAPYLLFCTLFAVIWNLLGIAYISDMNLTATMFSILFGGLFYGVTTFLILVLFTYLIIKFLNFVDEIIGESMVNFIFWISDKIQDLSNIVLFKCKK